MKDGDMSDDLGDDELEAQLRRLAARDDPVPPLLVEAAIDAFSWRDLDAELAELVFDSLLDADEASLVRSGSERRMVSFKTPRLTIDVEVSDAGASAAAGNGRSLMGQIVPPQRATVEIRHLAGTATADADELGRFQAGPLQPGPVSLRVRPAIAGAADGRQAVVTDWLSI